MINILVVGQLQTVYSEELDDYCLGYTKVFGEEGKQVIDDAIHAV